MFESEGVKLVRRNGKWVATRGTIQQPQQDVDMSMLERQNRALRDTLDGSEQEVSPLHEALIDAAYDVHEGVLEELAHHFRKWGDQYHTPTTWNAITMEEYGEVVKEMNDATFIEASERLQALSDEEESVRAQTWERGMQECVQMIACAIQWWYEMKRRKERDTDGTYTSQA